MSAPVPHLDRPFDYLVPASMGATAEPGCLVRVPFAGKDLEGYVLDRLAASEHEGRLARLRRVVSPVPVLGPQVLGLARAVADRYAGTLADVVRLAVPSRHAGAEKAVLAGPPPGDPVRPGPPADVAGWELHQAGPAFLAHVAQGGSPRAVLATAPGCDAAALLAVAARAALTSGRGALLVVPDHRDLDRLDAALTATLPPGSHVRLEADTGPEARWRAFLTAATGRARVVAGTRAAAFAPVADLGLVAILDDGDDSYDEQRAPYPHTREVLRLRAEQDGAAALLLGVTRTGESQLLLEQGWARPVQATREVLRARAPRILVAGSGPGGQDPVAAAARLPTDAWRVAREALAHGPVLVQVPRTGYVPTLACRTCRAPARCAHCAGPLHLAGAGETAACRWCGRPAVGGGASWRCPECSDTTFRAVVTGAARTAEELGRAFPGATVRTSGGPRVLDSLVAGPGQGRSTLVVATPGAEPVVEGGYAAALLLDGWAMLGRPDLRAQEQTLHRWLAAAARVRPAAAGGRVVVVADPQAPAVQALVRWDPATFAERELRARAELGLPPAERLAGLLGAEPDVAEAVEALRRSPGFGPTWRVLGPVPVPGRPGAPELVRTLVAAPLAEGARLGEEVKALTAGRSARKLPTVRVRIDPTQIG